MTNKEWLMMQEPKTIAEYIANCKCCELKGECIRIDERDYDCQDMIETWLNERHDEL